ncbi:MAG: ABC transporter permease [Xanthomonadaceae bacterium]|nr:ABC transporter permease [Xanthomonadaceae bacterium]MDP2186054.1 ABC transporter permease [Xanthomonadales bacterium]MDZ4116476.1 ABC transporter permease [Xanthomonadaceae bacterium]MDZ4377078.1 ABC transporter permease [Xanthomonadaceae bacterium]
MNAIADRVAPSLFGIVRIESWYEFLKVLRAPSFAVPTLLFPLVFYVMFAVVLSGQWHDYDKATYMLATFCVFGVVGPALFGFGVGVAMEREQGLLQLKRVSPMPVSAYFLAKIAMSLLFALITVLLLSAAAFVLAGVRMPPSTWLLLVFTMLIGTLPFSALGLLIGTLVKGQGAVAVVNLIYMPMAVLSGLWMPLFAFPSWVQQLAPIWPAWHLSQLALGVIGQAPIAQPWLHIGVLLAFTAVFTALAARRWQAL